MLHRAFSIFVFDNKGNLLLQKRAATKYHSAGLWTNSCCGHPRFGEALEAAANRRLGEEMGFDCPLKKVSSFIYHAILPN
ncbi:isopentenyl-diphosphate Delta-isomerase [Photorhabdus laumondii]|uniref:isopentenyl-diphosphate Delta-isomerase n=1 Tax=Photorhabdus laumondii TaxID=2218628 RepID=UPI0033159DF4